MRYFTWKLEFVSNILWIIIAATHIELHDAISVWLKNCFLQKLTSRYYLRQLLEHQSNQFTSGIEIHLHIISKYSLPLWHYLVLIDMNIRLQIFYHHHLNNSWIILYIFLFSRFSINWIHPKIGWKSHETHFNGVIPTLLLLWPN